MYYGEIIDGETVIDQVLLSVFKAPHSFSGEDTVEINCHGSLYIQQRIIQLLLSKGIALAQPGEFSQRAFLNGKIDLSQAEGIADLIAAQTETAHRTAMQHMRGGFRSKLSELRSQLLHFCSLIELELDFSEEDVKFADRKELIELIDEIDGQIHQLICSFKLGNAIKNGIPVIIAGKPNVGKSTLLNTILNEERALVSEIPGTTRDTIEDTLQYEGLMFRFIDTAGLRKSDDHVEKLGIVRTQNKLKEASVILYMADAKDPLQEINDDVKEIRKSLSPGQKMILLINKTDGYTPDEIKQKFQGSVFEEMSACDRILYISAKTKHNIPLLFDALVELSGLQDTQVPDVIVTNTRHMEALQKGHEAIQRARTGLQDGIPSDLVAQDIRETLHHIGKITGDITDNEILGNIFRSFCIGK